MGGGQVAPPNMGKDGRAYDNKNIKIRARGKKT